MVSSTSTNLNLTSSITSTNASGNKSTFKMNTSAKALNAQEQKKSTPTNAWASGVNPITQRSTVTAPNGTAASKTNISSKGLPASSKDAGASQKMPANNLAFLAANMKGLNATLVHKNGHRYSGIFSSLGDKGYTIKMARKMSSSGKQSNGVTGEEAGEGDERSLTLATSDVVDLKVDGVRLDKPQGRAQNGTSSNFRTDTDISSGRAVRERDLQKWEGASDPKVDMSLSGGLDGWDQFAAHKQMTGKDSTYDENNYTTKLDTSAPGFKEKMANAARIAREIETSTSNNAHQAEERGQINTRDDGIDEEAKYSGVQRNFQPLASGQPNRYTPPARRAPGGPPPPADATTPDDPAIISSSRPESAAPNKAQAPAAMKPAEAAAASTLLPEEPSVTTVPSTTEKATMSIPAIKSFAATQASSTRALPREGSATETVEKDVVIAFKHFSATEKLRIQDVHRLTARRDKAVKLNDLKKFAENFKLNTEVPSDLIPILTKDKDKQQAIMDRAKKNVGEIKATTPPRTTTTAPTDNKTAKPVVSRPESSVTSPQASHDRQNQQRSRPNQPNFNPNSARGAQAHMQQQQQMSGTSTRPGGPGNLGQRLQQNQNQRQHLANQHHQMPPQDPRMPPAGPASGVQSPSGSSTKWNPTASFTPNPTIQPFHPSVNPSNASSPIRNQAARPPQPAEKKPRQGNLFEGRTEGRKGPIPVSERVSLKRFNPIPRMEKEVKDAVAKEVKDGVAKEKIRPTWADNGGIPPAFKTPPRWEVSKEMVGKGMDDVFVPARKPSISPPHSTMPQPPFQGQIGSFHQAQHGGPMQHGQTPHHTPRHQPAQLTHGTPRYDESHGHPMAFSRSNSSFQPPTQHMQQYAPFGNQGGQPAAFYPAQGYQPGGQPMALRQSSQQGHQYYPQQPPSGHMMHVQPVGGQFPINPQMMYAAPGPVYQHPGTGMPHQGPNGYGSPRGAPMMQTPSQQGHVQPVMFMHQGPAYAPGAPMSQMRGGGNYTQIHQQPYSNSPGQFNPQPHRPTPSGSYAPPNMMPGAPPQGLVPNGAPIGAENVEDGK